MRLGGEERGRPTVGGGVGLRVRRICMGCCGHGSSAASSIRHGFSGWFGPWLIQSCTSNCREARARRFRVVAGMNLAGQELQADEAGIGPRARPWAYRFHQRHVVPEASPGRAHLRVDGVGPRAVDAAHPATTAARRAGEAGAPGHDARSRGVEEVLPPQPHAHADERRPWPAAWADKVPAVAAVDPFRHAHERPLPQESCATSSVGPPWLSERSSLRLDSSVSRTRQSRGGFPTKSCRDANAQAVTRRTTSGLSWGVAGCQTSPRGHAGV